MKRDSMLYMYNYKSTFDRLSCAVVRTKELDRQCTVVDMLLVYPVDLKAEVQISVIYRV
jgi:hypothetical protein